MLIEFIFRTALLVALTVLAGGFAFNLLVLRGSALQPLREALALRRRAWIAIWLASTLVALALDSLFRMLSFDLSLEEGARIFARMGFSAALAFYLMMFRPRNQWQNSKIAILLCGLLLLTQSLSGHPAREPAWLLPVITDWLHLVFVSIWIGGVAYYAGVVVPQVLAQRSFVPALGASIAKFSPLAMMSVLVIAITGIIQSASFVSSFDALFNTNYGRALLLKLMVFLVLMGFGALHQFVVAPQINAWRARAETQEDAARRFRISITIEALVSGIALAGAAAMTLLPLARSAL